MWVKDSQDRELVKDNQDHNHREQVCRCAVSVVHLGWVDRVPVVDALWRRLKDLNPFRETDRPNMGVGQVDPICNRLTETRWLLKDLGVVVFAQL